MFAGHPTWQDVCVKYHTRGLTLPWLEVHKSSWSFSSGGSCQDLVLYSVMNMTIECGESTFSNMWSGWKYGRNRASCRIFWWNWIHGQLYKNIVVKIYFSIFNETNKNVLVKARYFVFDLTQLMSFCSISEHNMIRFLS